MSAAQQQVWLIMSDPFDQHRRTVKTLKRLDHQQMRRWIWNAVNKADNAECLFTIVILKGEHHPSRHGIHVTFRPQDSLPNFPGMPPSELHGLLPYISKYKALRALTKNALGIDVPPFHDAFAENGSGWDTVKRSSFGGLARRFANFIHGEGVVRLREE